MGFVVKEDVQQAVVGKFSFRDREAFNLGGFPFAAGMAVYCFEGFEMTLALKQSMRERKIFPKVLSISFAWITVVNILFGTFGYIVYDDDTKDIITLNLPNDWTSIVAQNLFNPTCGAEIVTYRICGLMATGWHVPGLVFTFPIMVHPVCEILEGTLKKKI
ncbi:Amino acid transporter ANT1 [Hibiscus syriacus]|uniref:Amino acid transporter ANT1 n=1 Tax=Hibiscus syriacus TaxID=106335 RepID=A0A6A3ADH8_HIBSY|nr:Amino acid transporter ANT1 [Hibiscus syriacus]